MISTTSAGVRGFEGSGGARGISIATDRRGNSYVTGRFRGARVTFGAGEANETVLDGWQFRPGNEANETVLEAAGRYDVFVAKYRR